jgi:hypothetical protein
LPAPKSDGQRIGSVLCCHSGRSETLADTTAQTCTLPIETTNPCESRGCVAECPDLSLVDKESEEWRRRELNLKAVMTQRRTRHQYRFFVESVALQMRCIAVSSMCASCHSLTLV